MNEARCRNWTGCGPGQRVSTAAWSTRDYKCTDCLLGTYQTEQLHTSGQCLAVTQCGADEDESAAPTLSSDRNCSLKPITSCPGGYSLVDSDSGGRKCEECPAGTKGSNSTCIACDGADEFQTEVGQPTCDVTTICGPGQMVVRQPTPTTDRMCLACTASTYSDGDNQANCSKWTGCGPGTYVSKAGWSTNDYNCTSCDSGKFQGALSHTSDNCLDVAWCDGGDIETKAPTLSTDRLCSSAGFLGAEYATWGGISLAVCLACLAAVYRYRHKRAASRAHDFEAELKRLLETGNLDQEHASTGCVPREIDRRNITLVDRIGGGAFGEVWKGTLDESSAKAGVPAYLVAIKTVKADAGSAAEDELLTEATLMAQVPLHPNLVSIVGVITRGQPLMLVVSYCEGGSLQSFLRAIDTSQVTPAVRIRIGAHITDGMAFLGAHRFVHRDLAARNVLVGAGNVFKVADFGLSRGTTGSDNYYRSANGVFPIRWTSPEAMIEHRFTAASDVWSFGITMIEVYQDGGPPYPGLSTAEVAAKVREGHTHPQPPLCPDSVFAVIERCFDANPAGRPSFTELCEAFGAMMKINTVDQPAVRHVPEADDVDLIHSYVYYPPEEPSDEASTHGYAEPMKLNPAYVASQRTVQIHKATSEIKPLVDDDTTVLEFFKRVHQQLSAGKQPRFREALLLTQTPFEVTDSARNPIELAIEFAQKLVNSAKGYGLTLDQIAAIHIYTQETPFSRVLNAYLTSTSVTAAADLERYIPYIVLLLSALDRLPPVEAQLYHGVKLPVEDCLGPGVMIGDVITWWTVTRTTVTSDVLHDYTSFGHTPKENLRLGAKISAFFGGKSGVTDKASRKTVFIINSRNGAAISPFSAMDSVRETDRTRRVTTCEEGMCEAAFNEDEVLLLPGSQLRVMSITDLDSRYPGLTQVVLSELGDPRKAAGTVVSPRSPVPFLDLIHDRVRLSSVSKKVEFSPKESLCLTCNVKLCICTDSAGYVRPQPCKTQPQRSAETEIDAVYDLTIPSTPSQSSGIQILPRNTPGYLEVDTSTEYVGNNTSSARRHTLWARDEEPCTQEHDLPGEIDVRESRASRTTRLPPPTYVESPSYLS